MLKNVNLVMERSGEKINALLGDISDSGVSPVIGLLYDVELSSEEIGKIYRHGLRFNVTGGDRLLFNCKIFNVDDKYIKFICKNDE